MKKGNFKKLGAAVLAAIVLSFSSCGNEGASAKTFAAENKNGNKQQTVAAVDDEMRDITSAELVKEIKIGWNLGNTLDAEGTGLESETAWGNVKTTKEMITAVKDAGFNTVRIPVSWVGHMDSKNNVDKAWMDRVQEVVDYAYSQDMFVILNTHHEGWYDPYYDNFDAASGKLEALWKQIGERFENYDEKLIFEGMNEPRKRNTPMEWNGGDSEGWDVVNKLNSTFVDTVRGLGGNNAKRHLMIPTYAASSTPGAMSALTVPEDDKIIVSVHAYTPYKFALSDDRSANSFSASDNTAKEIDGTMKSIKTTFIDKGIPVIIGEMGARSKDNEDARAEWAAYYISKAKEIGVPCVCWDNGAFTGNGECFGLLDRSTCTWKFPKIVEGFMKGLE